MPYCTLDTTLVVIHPWRVYHDIVVVIDGFFCEHLVKKKISLQSNYDPINHDGQLLAAMP